MEVRHAALEGLNQILKHVNSEKVVISIIPNILALQNESGAHVKAYIGEGLGPIAKVVGYNVFNSKLGFMIELLIKDENSEVRLGYILNLLTIELLNRFMTSSSRVMVNY